MATKTYRRKKAQAAALVDLVTRPDGRLWEVEIIHPTVTRVAGWYKLVGAQWSGFQVDVTIETPRGRETLPHRPAEELKLRREVVGRDV